MLTEEISFNDSAPRNVAAPTPGQEVVPSTKLGDDGISEPTVSIPRDIINALVEDIKQFKDISFSDPAPGKVAALAWAWREGKDVVPSIKRRFGYMMSSKSYAQDLRKEVQNLADETERVNNAVEEAKNNARNVYSHVTDWQASAEKALEEAQDLLGDFEEVNKTCCYGTRPSPSFRPQFCRKAKDKIEDIKKLALEGGKFKELYDIFSAPAPGNVAAPNPARREGKEVVQSTTATASASSASTSIKLREDGVFESRAEIIRAIMDALADNGNRVVGIYGMGGVGKSTLLVDVKREVSKEKLFHWVAKADVSENPDIKTIQGEIADALGLTEIKNKETISGRAKLLHDRLKDEEREKKKVLIILDNLWKGLDLNKVGIPCGHDNRAIGCKLLLTSRDRKVLRWEMGCDKDFPLGELEEEEARSLFERLVGDKVHDDKFKPLVNVALDKCAGLPFLIVAMANRFKDADFSEWKDTLKQIKLSKNEGIGKEINERLQLSYKKLNDEEKSLLALCVAYGTSKPSLENLVRYGVGWGLIREDDNMEEARESLKSGICTLQASSLLLEDGDAYGFKIHDLVHEFVASVASRDHPLLILKNKDKSITELPKDKLKSCRAICFPYIDMEELPQELDCPELQIFLLFTNNESLKVPYSLFHSMRKLMVLNLTGIRLTCSPSSPFQFLENLHTLCLDDCSLDNVAILGELKGLQILSLANSNINRLPKEIGQLVELRLLDLNCCQELEIIEPGVLRSLIKLEELYMKNSFDQWNTVDQTPPTNACLIELNHMKNLCTLHVSIPNSSVLPEDLNVEKLTKYEILIGNVWCSLNECKGSRTLELELGPLGDVLQKGCIQSILGKVNHLFLHKVDRNEQSICALSENGFPQLKHLHVENSPSIHYILRQCSLRAFRTLELICLKNLVNLEKICQTHIPSKSFSTLKVVKVESCDKMKILFPLSLMREIAHLEEIRVAECNLMQKIVEADDYGYVELHNLQVLELCNMPNIKNFITRMDPLSTTSDDQVGTHLVLFNGQQVSIPSLESLTVIGLPNSKYLWSVESLLTLSNLQSLKISRCKSLSKVINFMSLLQLHKLQTLTIEDCASIKEIFDLVGPSTSGDVEALSELTTFSLARLPSLRCIWNMNPCGIVQFRNLKKLEVSNCDNLRFIFFSSMDNSLAKLRVLRVWDCEKMEAIIIEEEGLGRETSKTPAFPMLTDLQLGYLESLTCFSRRGWRETHSQDHVNSCSTVLFNREIALLRLETLVIKGMDNIEKIWDNQVAGNSFKHLKSLCVCGCNKLVNLVPFYILRWLLSLECLEARDCGLLEVVFELQPLNALYGHPIALPLKELKVSSLPKLKCVWDKEPRHQVKFQCLRCISVSECKSLTSLFPSSIAKDLIQLEELEVDGCGIVELIEKEEGVVPQFDFPKLTSLKLKHLIELKCIYTGTHALHWPALKTMEVHGCNKVEIFASQLENEMSLHKHPLFLIKKDAFPNLQELKLDLSKWMEIWHGQFHDGESFCKLRVLELHHLSKDYAISTCRFVESLTNLEELVICESYLEEPTSYVEVIEGPSQELKVLLPFSRYIRHLKTLDVSRCDELSSMFTPAIVGNLVALTKLTMSNCRMLTEVISDEESKDGHVVAFNHLKCMELDGLTRIKCFSSGGYTLMFPLLEDVIVSRCPNMKFFSQGPIEASKLERVKVSTKSWFWMGNLNITIQKMFKEKVMFAQVTEIRLSMFPELIGNWHNELNPIKSSWQLESLVVDKCPSFVKAIPVRLMLVLDNLSSLQVRDCELLEEIFDLKGLEVVENIQVLPQLSKLNLGNLPNLRQLWNKDIQESLRFESLGILILHSCSNLGHVFAPSMALCLPNLQWMEIKECSQMKGVITREEGQRRMVQKITFPNLHLVELRCLPNLTSFLLGKNHTLECSNLRELTIAHCPKMRSLTEQSLMEIDDDTLSLFTPQVAFPSLETLNITGMNNIKMIWENQVYFQHLKTLDVSHCCQLTHMFTPTIARNLVALTKLRISNCKMLIEVVSNEGGKEGYAMAFNQLKSMELDGLTGLRWFSSGGYNLMFPLLEDVIVTRCLNMKFFSKGPIEAPKVEKVQVSMEAWFWKGNLNMTIQKMYEEMVAVAGVEFRRLSEFPELIGKWQDEHIPIEPFLKLESLLVDKCPSFINAIQSILMLALHNLRILRVHDCKSLEEIFNLEGMEGVKGTQVLPQLWHLGLFNLPKLRRLWNKNLQGRLRFNSLSHLTLYKCSNLRHAFAPSMIQCFATLEYLEINECDQIEEVIAEEEGHGSAMEKITFPNLWWLELEYLPNLTSFLSGKNHTLECPDLKWLTIAYCPIMRGFSGQSLMEIDHGTHSLFTSQVAFPNLETLHITSMDNIEMIWDNQVAANSFPNLKSLCIQECKKIKCIWDKELHHQVIFQRLRSISIFRCKSLTSLCPASIARDLIQLKELEINGCGIVELIEKDGLVLRFVFPNLTFLKLEDLKELKCFYDGTLALCWSALKTLEVHDCNKVKILASQPKNEMPLHKQPLFLMEKVASLELLCITRMDNLEMIWDNQVYFQHLKILEVSHCGQLSYMFTLATAENLVELTELRISNCKMLAEVISDEGGKKGHEGASNQWKNMELDWLTSLICSPQKEGEGSAMETIRFPNLLRVELECLPNLTNFLSGNTHTLEWPKLDELTIARCPKMKKIGMLFPRPPSFISGLCTDIHNI